MNYSVIKTIDILNKSYQKIQELYLNHNLIDSLTGIEQFTNLKVFHIKFNFISDLNEFLKISNKSLIVSLNFIGNPAEAQLLENPSFLNNFVNLRNFNTSKEASILMDNSLAMNSSKIVNTNNNKVIRKLQFIEDHDKENINNEDYEQTDGFLTGNFNIKKENKQNYEENFEDLEEYELSDEEVIENNDSFQGKDAFETHISIIDNDICRLSVIFYEKLLKEKTLLGLKRYFLHSYYRENRFCQEFYQKILINRGFLTWRKRFVEKILLQNFQKNLKNISVNVEKKSEILSEELSTSSLMLRGKKQSINYNLRRITETDQDFIDSNRIVAIEKEKNLNVLRENPGKNKEGIIKEKDNKKIGFSEYKEMSMKNGKNEVITEENYRHDLPLSSTSFSSKCPYGSV